MHVRRTAGTLALVLCGAMHTALAAPAPRITQSVRIPLRDGQQLNALVIRSPGSGRQPVVLVQTPYDVKNAQKLWFGASAGSQPLFRSRELAFVLVDWRGFFGSKAAATTPMPSRGQDGYDTVEWIARQPWSNGRIGTYGASALAAVQYETAAARPPHLVCAVPIFNGISPTYETYFPGGVLRRARQWLLKSVGLDTKSVQSHPTRDWFWTQVEKQLAGPKDVHVPMLLVGGYWDPHDMVHTWKRLRAKSGAAVRAKHRLLLGPWHHFATSGEAPGSLVQLTPQERRYADPQKVVQRHALAFFQHYLRGVKNGVPSSPSIRYYQVGESRWEETPNWPPAGHRQETLFLHSSGLLAQSQPAGIGSRSYLYDPWDPSPTRGGSTLWSLLTHGPHDQREVTRRSDALLFKTGRLSKPYRMRGRVRAELRVSTNRPDTDFAIRLVEIQRDGTQLLVGEGIRRLKLRDSFAQSKLAAAGVVYSVSVSLTQELAYTFAAGSRIGLIVSSSNYPLFDRNPNTGQDFLGAAGAARAINSIHMGGGRTSKLVLPRSVEPAYDLPGAHTVKTLELPNLKDSRRHNRSVPLKVLYPAGGGPFPLVILSHGAGGNWDTHLYQAQHLASHGYVVVCPEHVFSNSRRVRDLMAKGLSALAAIHATTVDSRAALQRPLDVRFAIDQAVRWSLTSPLLKGKIDPRQVGMMGGSYGAYTTLVVCGARARVDGLVPRVAPGYGLSGDLSDRRVAFGLAMSPQGPGGSRFDVGSYRTVNRPLVCLSGTLDAQKGPGLTSPALPAKNRLKVFSLLPPGEKVFLWLENGDHFGYAGNPKQHLLPTRFRPAMQRISKAMMVLFSDYYLKPGRRAAARRYLSAQYAATLTDRAIPRIDWLQK